MARHQHGQVEKRRGRSKDERGLNTLGERKEGERMGSDREEEMERKRGGDRESGSGDPVPSLLVCVWGGAAVKSIVARGRGEEEGRMI